MKDPKLTLLEIVNHIASSDPDLKSAIEKMLLEKHAAQMNFDDANLLLNLNASLLQKSRSQLRQDLFVLHELGFKRNGFFVEFGATNGVDLSNTFLLETEFGWNGILAEPATRWHEDLLRNRKAAIDKRCVWSKSGENIVFNETSDPELSTVDAFSFKDYHYKSREKGSRYPVETVSLNDLLEEHHAPADIDYLSIDTEGSELEILEGFDFQKYNIKVITCEHNFTSARDNLVNLLELNGFRRKHSHISKFDDWWVSKGAA